MKGSQFRLYFIEELEEVYDEREAENVFFLLTDHFLNHNRWEWFMEYVEKEDLEFEEKVEALLPKLKEGKPIQQILGFTWFYDLKLQIDDSVLIPRPETEELVDMIVKEQSLNTNQSQILDIGTGSGCIALALAANLKNAFVTGIDVSEQALTVARKNAKQFELQNIEFRKVDILGETEAITMEYDVIVSNPPYISLGEHEELPARVKDHEPSVALFVTNDDPLQFYKAITRFALNWLKKKGVLYLECHENYAREVQEYLRRHSFEADLHQDLQGKDRMIIARKSLN